LPKSTGKFPMALRIFTWRALYFAAGCIDEYFPRSSLWIFPNAVAANMRDSGEPISPRIPDRGIWLEQIAESSQRAYAYTALQRTSGSSLFRVHRLVLQSLIHQFAKRNFDHALAWHPEVISTQRGILPAQRFLLWVLDKRDKTKESIIFEGGVSDWVPQSTLYDLDRTVLKEELCAGKIPRCVESTSEMSCQCIDRNFSSQNCEWGLCKQVVWTRKSEDPEVLWRADNAYERCEIPQCSLNHIPRSGISRDIWPPESRMFAATAIRKDP